MLQCCPYTVQLFLTIEVSHYRGRRSVLSYLALAGVWRESQESTQTEEGTQKWPPTGSVDRGTREDSLHEMNDWTAFFSFLFCPNFKVASRSTLNTKVGCGTSCLILSCYHDLQLCDIYYFPDLYRKLIRIWNFLMGSHWTKCAIRMCPSTVNPAQYLCSVLPTPPSTPLTHHLQSF